MIATQGVVPICNPKNVSSKIAGVLLIASKKANNSSYIELVSIFLPIIIIALMFGFSYAGLPTFLGFLIILLLLAAITIIVGYFLLSRISKKFLLLEMRN